MKHELLMRAIGELDDDLLEEARRPLPKKTGLISLFPRYAAAAACFLVICAATFLPFRGSASPAVSVGGTVLTQSSTPACLPLTAAMQQRATIGTEIPLEISAGKQQVLLSAGDGGVLLVGEETVREVTLSGKAQIIWLVDVTTQSTFELTLCWEDTTQVLTAQVSPEDNALLVTTDRQARP